MPPPLTAELFDSVLFVIVSGPLLRMPPPLALLSMAWLSDSVQLVIVIVPLLKMPPPPRPDEQPDTTTLVSVRLPILKMPPPLPLIWPSLIVRPEIIAVTLPSTEKMREAWLPST